jgi:TolB-like protein/Tfp pilus assembly protein PilF
MSAQAVEIRTGQPAAPTASSDIFISYASQDKAVADTVCDALERAGVTCWIAPRDVTPGEFYAESIVHAIDSAKAMVLVLSQRAADSQHVLREVERATSKRHPVVSYRIDLAPLPAGLEYFLNTSQWLDASATGVDRALPRLVNAVGRALAQPAVAACLDPDHDSTEQTQPGPSRVLIAFAVIATAALAIAILGKLGLHNPAAPVANHAAAAVTASPTVAVTSEKSVAVLPFLDMSEKQDEGYFSDGLSEELIDLLCKVPNLKVPARTSSFYFKSRPEDIPTIARRLMVAHVLEGSVRKSGNRVRITVQLVRADNGYHLWSETYDRQIGDVFKMQDEIAGAVVKALKLLLLPAAAARLAQPQHVASAGAYDAYLKGRFHAAQLTPADLQSALRSFEESVAKDPGFALAYAALAETYSWGAGLGFMPPQQALEKSEQAALKALRLDPDLATAHHALAWVRYARQWDFAAAETEFRRSIELAPGNVTAHLWYGMFLAQRERRDEALRQFREARALDPLADVVAQLALTALLTSRQYPQLVSEALALQESNPQSWMIGWFVLSAYERQGALKEAIAERERQAVAFGKSATAARKEFDAYRKEYARHGPRAYWTLLRRQMSDSDATTAYERSVLDAHLGAREPMYAELGAALQSRSTQLLYWESSEPAFDPYRAEAQFRDHTTAVEQMGGNLAK